jgi:hypothetical protein
MLLRSPDRVEQLLLCAILGCNRALLVELAKVVDIIYVVADAVLCVMSIRRSWL